MKYSDAFTLREQFEAGELPPAEFSHARHVEVAREYLLEFGMDAAAPRFCEALKRFAANAGAAGKYHHTVTIAWLRLVHAACRATPGVASFPEFAALHPWLFAKGAVERFYSRDLLAGAAARTQFVESDIAPLP